MKLSRLLIAVLFVLASNAAMPQSVSERLQNLRGMVNSSAQQQFLHPDEAFVMSAAVKGPERVTVQWQIAEGYYLYHNEFNFEIIEGDASVDQAGINVPPGVIKEDPSFGKVEVNIGDTYIEVPLVRTDPGEVAVTLQIGYQGCKDNSLCYPPIKKTLPLILSPLIDSGGAVTSGLAAALPSTAVSSARTTAPMVSEHDSFTLKLMEGSVLFNVLLFFGAGLLLSFTPCVFPMIPILSGIIVGQEKTLTPMKGFILSLVYVLAMALTYAALGVIAAMANVNVQAAAQNVWVIAIFCLVFVALAMSMFGFYEIQLPSSLQSRLMNMTSSRQGGTLTGVAIMGAVSAVIVGPCVAPPLIGALAYISQTGNEVLGGLALFAMGMGMGVPLLIIGGSAGSVLPRAGKWMDTVKRIFGVGLLGLAIWFLSRVVSAEVEMYLWAILLIISAIYMGALDQLEKAASWARLWKGMGLIMLIYGVLLVIGASSGSKNMYRPLEGLVSGSIDATEHLDFKRIKSVADLELELRQASQAGKYVMLDFYADWCIECIRMEKNTFPRPEVQAALENIILLQADVTRNDDLDKALLNHFGIYGPPAILFFDTNGEEILPYRLFGFVGPDRFAAHVLDAIGT
jgi:thiol:disulfide interchange protein DsbD